MAHEKLQKQILLQFLRSKLIRHELELELKLEELILTSIVL